MRWPYGWQRDEVENDPPTLSEIARVLADFRSEMRGQLAAFQRADVYAAERRETDLRIANIEDRNRQIEGDMSRAIDDKNAMRRTLTLVIVGAFLAFVFNLVLLFAR